MKEKWIEERLFREAQDLMKDMVSIMDCLTYFKWLAKKKYLKFNPTMNIIDCFYMNYMDLYKQAPKEVNHILKSKKFNEMSALQELLYFFLDNQRLTWFKEIPFINKVENKNEKYTITTSIGKIQVKRASDYFSNTSSSFIFKKTLIGKCFDRTAEFIQENPDYEAVVSYLPNIFTGGHYHAYAKKDDIIVDSACNAIFFNHSGELVDNGRVVAKVSLEELNRQQENNTYPKLLVAAFQKSKTK